MFSSLVSVVMTTAPPEPATTSFYSGFSESTTAPPVLATTAPPVPVTTAPPVLSTTTPPEPETTSLKMGFSEYSQ